MAIILKGTVGKNKFFNAIGERNTMKANKEISVFKTHFSELLHMVKYHLKLLRSY